MKLKGLAWGLAVGSAMALLAGCGGTASQSFSDSGTRGDGSIPIGRAKGPQSSPLSVTLRFDDGSVYETTPDSSGTVRIPSSVPEGDWKLSFSQTPDETTISFVEQPRALKTQMFDINLLPKKSQSEVTGVSLGLDPTIHMKVGENIKLKPVISGTSVQGLTPSYWTSGGIGRVVPGGVFTALVPGTGSITVDVAGKQDSVQVVVE